MKINCTSQQLGRRLGVGYSKGIGRRGRSTLRPSSKSLLKIVKIVYLFGLTHACAWAKARYVGCHSVACSVSHYRLLYYGRVLIAI